MVSQISESLSQCRSGCTSPGLFQSSDCSNLRFGATWSSWRRSSCAKCYGSRRESGLPRSPASEVSEGPSKDPDPSSAEKYHVSQGCSLGLVSVPMSVWKNDLSAPTVVSNSIQYGSYVKLQ